MSLFSTFANLIQGAVGNNRDNDEGDVFNVKNELARQGYYRRSIENGIIDADTNKGIRDFQRDNNLKRDGYMLPGGETEQKMLALRVSDDEIEKEKLPDLPLAPKFRGPGLSRRSKSEDDWQNSLIYDPFKARNDDAAIPLLSAQLPNWNFDKSMPIPVPPPKEGIRRRKYWDF